MKKILFVLSLFLTAPSFAQDSTQVKMKEWLGVLTVAEKYKVEKNWTDKDRAVVEAHFQRLIKYKNEGVVAFAGRTLLALNNPDMMGLVIFYANNGEEALQFMQDDPAVKSGIMLAKVHSYGIALNKCD